MSLTYTKIQVFSVYGSKKVKHNTCISRDNHFKVNMYKRIDIGKEKVF